MVDFDRLLNAPCVHAFARPVVFKPRAGSVFPTQGVFDNDYELVAQNEEGPIATTSPIVSVRASELPIMPQKRDKIVIGPSTYEIVEVKPDSEGMLILRLLQVK